jgi:murein DD-endopeptidase MepM/ murein hydrolase activator NlpD
MYGNGAGAGSAGVHTVSKGETLYTISQRYHIVMRDIVVTNNMSAPFKLASGQRLKLPPPQQYRVRNGDTLYEVSRLFGVESTEIARLNQMNAPYVLKGGQVLKLPSVTEKTAPYSVQTAVSMPAVPPTAVQSELLAPPPGMEAEPQKLAALPGQKPQAPAQTANVALAPQTKISSATPARASERFLSPVKGKLVSGYGPKTNGLHNDGMNIAAPRGTPIQAADNGVVVYAGNELKGSGNLVLIRHADRWMTAYAHMDKISVKRGDVLKRGQSIGTVGTSGSVDTPQLHFEVRRGTEAINPARYLES